MPTPNPTTRREYKGAAAATTLSSGIGAADASFTLVAANNWPTGSVGTFIVTIDRGQTNEERILCSAQASRVVTVAGSGRGFDGTTAASHSAGATVECTLSAFDADEWNQHTNAAAGVHGVTGSVVGTSDTQTLTNKTFSGGTLTGSITASGATLASPTLNQPTINSYYAVVYTDGTGTGTGSATVTSAFTYLAWTGTNAIAGSTWSGANPTRLAAPVAGLYLVTASLWFTNSTSSRVNYVFRKNGTTIVWETDTWISGVNGANGAAGITALVHLAANDYIELGVASLDANNGLNVGNNTHPQLAFALLAA